MTEIREVVCPSHMNIRGHRFCRKKGNNGLKVAEGSEEDTHLASGLLVTWNVEEKQPLTTVGEVSSENLPISEER